MIKLISVSVRKTKVDLPFTLSKLIEEGEKSDEDSQDSGIIGRGYADYVRSVRRRQQDRTGSTGQDVFCEGRKDADTTGSKHYEPPFSAEYAKRT